MWLWWAFVENKDSIMQLPTEVKTILSVALAVCLIKGISCKAVRFLKTVIVVAVVYYLCAFTGIL